MTGSPTLEGQVAVVTGSGSPHGIGFATARALLAAGATVVVTSTTDRIFERVAELQRTTDQTTDRVHGVVADLTAPRLADALIAHAVGVAGQLDVCVNNAGMVALGTEVVDQALLATSDEQWRAAIERNLFTSFAVTRAALAVMQPRRYGRVVNVASTSGPVQAFVGDVGYHAAKAGMLGLTRAAALEFAPFGITVNAVAPGWIATASQTDAEHRAGLAAPTRRSGRADEVAAVIRFLVEPAASYVTGQLVVVDGGNSLAEDRTWRPPTAG